MRCWSKTDTAFRKKNTHQKSPHSWHIPWLSTACSSSPSPERVEKTKGQDRGGKRGRGRGSVNTASHNHKQTAAAKDSRKKDLQQQKQMTKMAANCPQGSHSLLFNCSICHYKKPSAETKCMNGTESKYGNPLKKKGGGWLVLQRFIKPFSYFMVPCCVGGEELI